MKLDSLEKRTVLHYAISTEYVLDTTEVVQRDDVMLHMLPDVELIHHSPGIWLAVEVAALNISPKMHQPDVSILGWSGRSWSSSLSQVLPVLL